MKVYTFAVSIPAIDKEPVLVVKFRGKEILYCLIGFGIGVGFCLLCKLCKKLLFSRTPLTDAIAAAVRTEELKEVREHDETRTQFITPQFKQYNTIQQQQQQRKDVIVNEEFKEEEQQHNHHHQSNDDETFFLNNEQIIRNVFNDENRQKQLRRRYKRFSQRNHDRRHINLNFSHQHNLNDIDRLIQLQNDLDQLKSGIWHRSAIFTEVDSGIETKPSSMQNSMKKSNSTDTLQLEDGQVVDQALEQIGRLKTDMDNLCQDIQHLSSSPSMPLSESDQLKTDLNRKKISPNSPNKSTNLNKTNPNKLALEKLRLKNNMKNIVDELNLDRTELDKAIDSAVRQTYEDKYGSEFSAIINHNEKKFRNNSIDDEEESMINVGDEFDWELSSIDSTSAGPGASANNSVQRFKRNSTVHSLLDKKHLIRTRSCGKDLMKDKIDIYDYQETSTKGKIEELSSTNTMTEGSLSEIDFEISSNNYPKDVYEESSEINTGSFETVTSIDSNNFLHKSFENLSECRRGSVDSYLLKEDLNYMSNLQSICGELQRSNDEYSLLSSSTKTLCGERSVHHPPPKYLIDPSESESSQYIDDATIRRISNRRRKLRIGKSIENLQKSFL